MDAEGRDLRSTGVILGRETGARVVHVQLKLPCRHRGFGLSHINYLTGRVAHLSAAALAWHAREAGPDPFWPFEGPMGAQLRQPWEALHDTAEGL
jgi:hypothetical protein